MCVWACACAYVEVDALQRVDCTSAIIVDKEAV